jgi:hypothetical protein
MTTRPCDANYAQIRHDRRKHYGHKLCEQRGFGNLARRVASVIS